MHSLILIIAIITSGCASLPKGLQMSEDERAACAAEGCSVWTLQELENLIGLAAQRGFQAGRKNKGIGI